MKNYFLLLPLLLLLTECSHAQEFPSYGKVTPEELKLKECAFDKEATAVVLIDEAISNYNDEHNLITNHHLRIKILKDKGVDYANISIPFFRGNDFEYINHVEGMVINTNKDGSTTIQNLEKKLVYTTNISDNHGEVRFTFPSITTGSIIDYRYQSTMKHYGGLDDWYFQKEIPVLLSKYVLYIIPRYEFTYQVYKNNSLDIKVEPDPRDGRVLFEMKSIPGLDQEPYMDARRDYLQRVTFQLSGYGGSGFDKKKYMTSWDELTRELMTSPNFGLQLNKDLAGTEEFIKLVKENASPIEKMKQVYYYVRNNMVWNGYNSKYSIDGIKSAWNKKKGTSGDVNLILINLLKAAGLEPYPMLVSERYNGKINTKYPFVDQFNTVYAAVFINGSKYFLDATDKLTPPHITPNNILNTTTFIVDKKAGGLVAINDQSLQYRDIINVMATITPDASIKGEVFVKSTDYARIRRMELYSRNASKYIDENFKQSNESITIDSFTIENGENDSLPLQHRFTFMTQMNATGEYKFIPLNLFSGFERNPFISDKRFSEINFGYKRSINVNLYLRVSSEYSVDALPKSVQLVNADKTVVFIREILQDVPSNTVVGRLRMDFKKSFYSADEYDEIKEFYKKMFEMLNEQIVLKKKS